MLGEAIERRQFITLLGGAAAACPLAARAQQSTVALVGLLTGSHQDDRWLGALRQGFKEAGFIEGRNVAIKHRSADGHFGRVPALAAELVADPVALIIAIAPSTALAAKAASATIHHGEVAARVDRWHAKARIGYAFPRLQGKSDLATASVTCAGSPYRI